MAILPKKVVSEVVRIYARECGLVACFMDLSGRTPDGKDPLAALPNLRRKRSYALQDSINLGEPSFYEPAPGLGSAVIALEDRRMVQGGLLGGEAFTAGDDGARRTAQQYLVDHGVPALEARRLLAGAPTLTDTRLREAAAFLQTTFYEISGWNPELLKENRLKNRQRQQIAQAIEAQKRFGRDTAIYAFEKERILLASIRAGDRPGARRILNEMLATIYLSSPELVVLRARTVELMSCLTRAAIEDNPLLEPLIERNHAWTENLIHARSFEGLSQELMGALDDFIDGIYLHGMNRSNTSVRKALDYISGHFAHPLTLAEVAREAGLSVSRLCHLVKAHTGRTVLQILMQIRVQHAQHLLERTSKSCTDIAYETGFGDQSYFTKHFRRLSGITPARYRRSRQTVST